MSTKKIIILGYSDAYITMIFDMFKDKGVKFKILDNLTLFDKERIHNKNINYEIISELEDCDYFLYGSAKTSTRKKLIETFNVDKSKLTTIISKVVKSCGCRTHRSFPFYLIPADLRYSA